MQYSGVFVDIFKIVGQKAQFVPIFTNKPTKHLYTIAKPNDGTLILYVASHILLENIALNYHVTTTYTEETYRLIITPPGSLSSYEKLVMPFDKVTWILLSLTFLITFIVIKVVHRKSKKIQNIIFGEKVCAPAYNVVGILFGIPQPSLPKNSFARFILMMFIIFCLIFRTAYVGVIFELLALNIQKQSPQTLIELMNDSFALVPGDVGASTGLILQQILKILNETPLQNLVHDSMIQGGDRQTYAKLYLQHYDKSEPKLAFFATDDIMGEFNNLCKCSSLFLAQILWKQQIGLTIDKDHFLFDQVEETLQKIIPFGIPNHFVEYHKWVLYKSVVSEKISSKAFSFHDISIGFIIWIITCSFAFLCFVCEVLWVKFKFYGKEFLGLIFLFYLIYQRLKTIY
ncbi:hypothetical protein PVAND_002094 [Polypedilum vanderplanki]|uniref:Ionotropic glutamate receptor C-terminal domain-containing protein n=1 Tax=Polypedilum vanderplanki TaxID=319348 RepID=A0A9J6BRC3_POLVA|nr:hypothetical protein PVAND_002094 [Polypedilum vanderplanki]